MLKIILFDIAGFLLITNPKSLLIKLFMLTQGLILASSRNSLVIYP
jgi:hypothetical protein